MRIAINEFNQRMEMSEREVLEKLRRNAEEDKALFSNPGQELQERTAVAGLLRVLGIEFREDEIVKRGPEPIDVSFREARFQVTEDPDRGRPRNLEIKQQAVRVKTAKRLRDLFDPGIIASHPMAPDELVARVSARCREKAQKYAGKCSDIDLLIYVNLRRRHLYPSGPFPEAERLESFGWRSVSVIMEPYAIILWADDDAPAFLVRHKGQAVFWTGGPDSLFPKLGAG